MKIENSCYVEKIHRCCNDRKCRFFDDKFLDRCPYNIVEDNGWVCSNEDAIEDADRLEGLIHD